jgi:hypothetical protein
MWITKVDFNVDEQSIDSRFLFRVDFEYYENQEAPITFTGFLKSIDGKKIATIDCDFDNYNPYSNIGIPTVDKVRNIEVNRNNKSRYSRNFSAGVSKQSIDYLEKQRLERPSKNVILNLELEIITLKFDNSEKRELKIERYPRTNQIEIEQSTWLKKYSSKFGIGEFLIIEFSKQNIKVKEKAKKTWVDKLERAQTRLGEMETHLSEGKWEKVMETSRKIWDTFKLYKENTKLKEDFKELFDKNNYSDSGLEDFIKSIWHIHDFASKFIHDNDKKGENLNPIPQPQKEDAYFMYLWTMGFINLINEKVKGLE